MLPPKNRLRKTLDIDQVWKRGRSSSTAVLQLKFFKTGAPDSRFAIVMGTKAEKRAVKRNLFKRRVREALRLNLASISPGVDVIVTGKKPAVDASYASLLKSLRDVFLAAKLWTDRPVASKNPVDATPTVSPDATSKT